MNSVMLEHVILGKSYLQPLDDVEDFKKELQDKNFKGNVLLDSLLAVGFASNRYSIIPFDGENFDYNHVTIQKPEYVPESIKQESYEFLSANRELIQNNYVLRSDEKKHLINDLLPKVEPNNQKFVVLNPSYGYLSEEMKYTGFDMQEAGLFTQQDLVDHNLTGDEFVKTPLNDNQLSQMPFDLRPYEDISLNFDGLRDEQQLS